MRKIITESKLRGIIKESIVKVLSEGISDITYHFTNLDSCIKLLSKNVFYLTLSTNKSDAYDDKRLFFLSTQRSRNKELGYGNQFNRSCVRIQLDGRMLSTIYKGRPIDYWGTELGKRSYYNDKNDRSFYDRQRHSGFEMEDRILSYEPEIKDASKYITRIDVYIADTEEIEKDKIDAMSIYALSCRLKIPCYCYLSLKDFNNMTNNTINDEIIELVNNRFKFQKAGVSADDDIKKARTEFYRSSKKVEILFQLLNILTVNKIQRIGSDPQYYKLVANVLQKYGLEKYKNDIFNYMKTSHFLGNASAHAHSLYYDVDPMFSKLAHEYDDEDSIKIMRFGADVLKHFGVNNFKDLETKLLFNDSETKLLPRYT